MTPTEEYRNKLNRAQEILDYTFEDEELLLAAITHPSATEGKSVTHSYERLEFLGDSILGAIVAEEAYARFPELDEGGLTRIKVALVSGSSLSESAAELNFEDIIIFGSSETGTGKRGLHSALENVYEAIVAALFLDGGIEVAESFIDRTLIPRMSHTMAKEPENPKSALQEKLQEDGITPTYKLVETQGPPHDRTFVAQVFAGMQGLARGQGRTKKEAESKAAQSALASLSDFFAPTPEQARKAQAKADREAALKADREAVKAEKAAVLAAEKAQKAAMKAEEKARRQRERENARQAKQKKQG
ncbi:MAG: ribonuclease III [Raoultibacter sp.]|jgi:ribonuclease-3